MTPIPLNMPPAEAERWASATGDTDRAALLARVRAWHTDRDVVKAPNVLPHPPEDTSHD